MILEVEDSRVKFHSQDSVTCKTTLDDLGRGLPWKKMNDTVAIDHEADHGMSHQQALWRLSLCLRLHVLVPVQIHQYSVAYLH